MFLLAKCTDIKETHGELSPKLKKGISGINWFIQLIFATSQLFDQTLLVRIIWQDTELCTQI